MKNRLIASVLVLCAAEVSAQTMTASAEATAVGILIRYSVPDLPFSTSCTWTLYDSGGSILTTSTQSTGGTTRSATFSSLSPATAYAVSGDCGLPYDTVSKTTVTTAASQGSNLTVSVQLPTPTRISGATRCQVSYGATSALGSSAQNTSCGSGGTVNLTLNPGTYYASVQWQNSSNVVLQQSTIQAFTVGHTHTQVFTSTPSGGGADEPAVPDLATFNSRMTSAGATRCAALVAYYDNYYDIVQSFKYVADYTGDAATWLPCRDTAADNWLTGYVIPNNGGLTGYRNITWGTRQLAQDTGRMDAFEGTEDIATRAAFCTSPPGTSTDPYLAREYAYCVRAEMEQRKLGQWNQSEFQSRLNNLFTMLDHWMDGTYRFPNPEANVPQCSGYYYLAPFMPSLVLHTLIQVHDEIPESEYGNSHTQAEIETYTKNIADFLWDQAWLSANQAFWYENCKPTFEDAWPAASGAPDINLLIAPVYAKVYQWTCDTTYRDRADTIWSGGIPEAYLGSPKHYSENHFWALGPYGYIQVRGPKELKQQGGSNILLEDNSKILREVACP